MTDMMGNVSEKNQAWALQRERNRVNTDDTEQYDNDPQMEEGPGCELCGSFICMLAEVSCLRSLGVFMRRVPNRWSTDDLSQPESDAQIVASG